MNNFLKTFLVLFLCTYTYADSCPGEVIEKNIEGLIIFTGKCKENDVRVWGETEWIDTGDVYVGFHHSDGDRKAGTYTFNNGDFIEGIWEDETSSKNNLKYDLIGRYHFEYGAETYGYHLGSSLNGFGATFYEDDKFDGGERDYEVGIWKKDNNALSGYGARGFKTGTVIYGFWGDTGLIGDGYWVEEDGRKQKYSFNKGKAYGPYNLNNSDENRLEQIQDFINTNLEQLNDIWDVFEEEADDYSRVASSFIEDNITFDYEQNYSELVQSIQELLTELGYSPGPIDGYLGNRTSAAIKAFEYELELDEVTGMPSEEILVALQLTIRAKNASSNQTLKSEPIFLGTGSGFYVNTTDIVTNHHVVKDCEYLTDNNDRKLDVKVSDVFNDIALLSGPSSDNFMNISENPPQLGEKVYVSGFPLNSELNSFMITSGNVSSLTGYGKNFTNFSHTAPSQPGNSGGAITNEYGSVIGILVAAINEDLIKEISGSLPQNINFGIKNTVLKSLLNDNNSEFKVRDSFFTKSQKSVADISKKSSVLIKCYGFPESK